MSERAVWPPIGDVVLGNPESPVAVCTLASRGLLAQFAGRPEVAIAGRVFTENVGVERMIQNLVANPGLRVLILCGRESFHMVGQTIEALHRHGLDDERRVVGSSAPEPFLPNLRPAELELFRQMHLIDMIGELDTEVVLARARGFAQARAEPSGGPSAGPLLRSARDRVERISATPDRRSDWRYDPTGFFLVFVDRRAEMLQVGHYSQARELLHIVEGRAADALCHTLVRLGLVTELDHAAYLGRELARAEAALRLGLRYEQDSPLDPTKPASPTPLP